MRLCGCVGGCASSTRPDEADIPPIPGGLALGASTTSPVISDQTKAEGEQAVRPVFPQATIVRPRLVFGEDDHFFNRFAAMIRRSPVLPLIGGGTTKFQPVFVGDMAAGGTVKLRRFSQNTGTRTVVMARWSRCAI